MRRATGIHLSLLGIAMKQKHTVRPPKGCSLTKAAHPCDITIADRLTPEAELSGLRQLLPNEGPKGNEQGSLGGRQMLI